MSRTKRTLLLCLAAVALLLAAAAVAFPPLVRSRAASAAARLGASLSIRSVRPSLSGARLADVRLTLTDIPGLSIHFDSVAVALSGDVSVVGGRVDVHGPRQLLAEQVGRWRSARPPADGGGSGGRQRRFSVAGLALHWPGFDGEGTQLSATDLRSADLLRGEELRAGSIQASTAAGAFDATGLLVGWSRSPDLVFRQLQAASIRATVRLAAPLPPPPEVAGRPPSPVSPAKVQRPEPPGRNSAPAPEPQLPPGPSLRDRLVRQAADLGARCAPDAFAKVDAFVVHVQRGDDSLSLGPGALSLAMRQRSLHIDLAPGAQPDEKGVLFRAQVPMDQGPVVLDVEGGPIQLSTLGVKEGDLGLTATDKTSLLVKAHVELMEDGRAVSFDGNVKAAGLSIFHGKLADAPVEGLSVAARLKGDALLDGTRLRLEDSEVDVGALQLMVSGLLDRDAQRRLRVDARFGIPLVSCQQALDSLPEKLVPVVHGMRLAGTLSLTGRLRFDPARPQDFLFDYRGSSDCRFLSVPEGVDANRFRQPFKRVVYGPDNKRLEVDAGPGAPGWVPIGAISQHMEAAVMTTEDGRFRVHHGFDHEAIHNSLKDNLQKGAFVRGASTISMQLAKNLYLERKKTLSRKLQELILTMYLEQVLTKEQILELYLNVVEFGPMVYGIGPAASHYFRCSPSELTPGQAMFLSSILPQPKLARFGAGGRLNDGWMNYLYKLIKLAQKRGWIGAEDAEVALEEWVMFGGPPVRTAASLPGASASEPELPLLGSDD
jgi:hypothetical protein